MASKIIFMRKVVFILLVMMSLYGFFFQMSNVVGGLPK